MIDVLFQGTVDRALVHRAAVAEVFVTDMRRIDATHFIGAAQLPLAHSHYNDHAPDSPYFDIMLIAETCRQTAMYGVHRFLEIDTGTAFVVNSFELHLVPGPGLLIGDRPGELRLLTTYPQVKRRGERIRRFRAEHELRLSGHLVGRCGMDVSALTAEEYRTLRSLGRTGDPPSTGGPRVRRRTADPQPFGRDNPANVVLSDPSVRDGKVTALLDPDFGNRSIFDHEYDHHPGMVLLEAARQCALLAGRGTRRQVVGLTITFRRFAELDEPVLVTASGGGRPSVVFHQAGAVAAEAVCTIEEA